MILLLKTLKIGLVMVRVTNWNNNLGEPGFSDRGWLVREEFLIIGFYFLCCSMGIFFFWGGKDFDRGGLISDRGKPCRHFLFYHHFLIHSCCLVTIWRSSFSNWYAFSFESGMCLSITHHATLSSEVIFLT